MHGPRACGRERLAQRIVGGCDLLRSAPVLIQQALAMWQAGKGREGASQTGMMGSTGSAPVLIQQALVMGQAGTAGEGHVEEVEGSISSSPAIKEKGQTGSGTMRDKRKTSGRDATSGRDSALLSLRNEAPPPLTSVPQRNAYTHSQQLPRRAPHERMPQVLRRLHASVRGKERLGLAPRSGRQRLQQARFSSLELRGHVHERLGSRDALMQAVQVACTCIVTGRKSESTLGWLMMS